MLDVLRRNAQSWVVQVLLGIIAIVFIFFMGGGGAIGRTGSSVATVGDTQISVQEWQRAESRNRSLYQEQYGDRLTPELLQALDLPSLSLNQLIDQAVLREQASRMGLRVPDEAVRAEIREVPAFQRDGQFSPDAYRAVMQRQGLAAGSFETALRDDLLVEQLIDVVRRGAHVTDQEALEDYQRDNEKVVLEYVKIAASGLEDEVTVDEAGLTTFYEENSESYRVPESVRIRYMAYAPDHFIDPASVSDEEIEEYYVLNEDTEFTVQETVSARHILKTTETDADDETKQVARAAIDKVIERLDAGEDFAEVAKEESEDKGSGARGGDLGSFGRGRMVKPFEDTAFSLKVGERSGVVESQFGYHVILVYDRQESGTRTLEEVHDDIAKKLATGDARDKAFDAAAGDALTVREGTSFETIAAERDIEIQTTSPVSRGNTIPGVGPANALIDAVLALDGREDVADPIGIGDTYYVAAIEERADSYIPELAEIREKVEAGYRKERAADLARARADELLAEIKIGTSITDVAQAAGLEAEETTEFNRRGGFVPGVGNLPGVKQIVFSGLGEGEPLPRTFTNRGDAYVFVLKSRTAADTDEFEQVKQDRIAALLSRKEGAAVGEFVRELKETAKISYNNELIDSVLNPR